VVGKGGKKGTDTGLDWRGLWVLLANRKHGGNDLAASATRVRRKSQLWLLPGTTGIGEPMRSPELADRE